jgi:serine/threonine protein phosphatase 1
MRFAIADIHGCCKTFKALIDKLDIGASDTLYLLGDSIDRGPDSKGVLDVIMRPPCEVVPLLGNHEDMWLRVYSGDGNYKTDDPYFNTWMANGGGATLKSFEGTDTRPYIEFIKSFPPFLELEDFLLVHAEFDFSLPDPFGQEGIEAMLWSRGRRYRGKKPVICGHTPLPLEQILSGLKTNRINIDNGCCYTDRIGCHNLLAYCLDNGQLYIQRNIEDASPAGR